ncbi:efflux RND transporter periplasmic adaptor subunit [Cysteiniphilum sp. JM-1]|uniref:efflux RND transporter periplasmic adaptor subunit n=1 Tax=Cysteiniphilum sp. JM-1 TaxID=2610891 RepID=UPI0012464F36|nr:HlyD family efflux transporter periplasmic adaptor subunit [Cysteiniphilum sp. JM-1]
MESKVVALLSITHALFEKKTLRELAFFIAHHSVEVIPYQTSIVWSEYSGSFIDILAMNNIVELDRNSPFSLQLKKCIKQIKLLNKGRPNETLYACIPQTSAKLLEEWPDNLEEYIAYTPLLNDQGIIVGGILLVQNKAYDQEQKNQYLYLQDAYRFAWQKLVANQKKSLTFWKVWTKKRVVKYVLLILVVLIMSIPVRQSVIAPAEIVANSPTIISAPFDGVVDSILVSPNQFVTPNFPLVQLNERDLKNAYRLAEQELNTSESKYQKAINTGFSDLKNRAEIKVLKSLAEEKKLELQYASYLLNEAKIISNQSGIVIINDPYKWKGKPVMTGEKILEIANPHQVEIKIWLPVMDAINFANGDDVNLFLNNSPLKAINATIKHIGINAEMTDNQILAYPITAEISTTNSVPKIGSQGYAKIYGQKTVLFFYLFRKPITALRQYFGW